MGAAPTVRIIKNGNAKLYSRRETHYLTESLAVGGNGTSNGPGMIGGKTPQNLFHGLPSVRVIGNTETDIGDRPFQDVIMEKLEIVNSA